MLNKLLALLADGQFHSGEELGEALGVSRAAVWKQLKKLDDLDIPYSSVKGKGYRLHDAIELDGLEGSVTVESPPAWDDDDVSAVLLIDWSRRGPSVGDSPPFLPGPGLAAVLLCLIVTSLPSRRKR